MIVDSGTINNRLTHIVPLKHVREAQAGTFIKATENAICFKPAGIWLSVDGEWEDWCLAEHFSDSGFQFEATLKPGLNIFIIDRVKDFQNLLELAGLESDPDPFINIMKLDEHAKKVFKWLYKNCDGLMLTSNGQARTRFGTRLYGWDVASICLFNPKNVTLKPIGPWGRAIPEATQ